MARLYLLSSGGRIGVPTAAVSAMSETGNPIFCALDTPSVEAARTMAERVAPHVGGLKLGLEKEKGSVPFARTYDSIEEHDAYYLASACLLPENAVKNTVNGQKSVEKMARDFDTSKELVEYRIKRLGLWRAYKGIEIRLANKDGTTKN